MNKFLTYTARSKLNCLVESSPGCIAIGLSCKTGGCSITQLFSRDAEYDIIISNSPYVLTDVKTFSVLKNSSIDFNYDSGDFIITKDSNVVPTIA